MRGVRNLSRVRRLERKLGDQDTKHRLNLNDSQGLADAGVGSKVEAYKPELALEVRRWREPT